MPLVLVFMNYGDADRYITVYTSAPLQHHHIRKMPKPQKERLVSLKLIMTIHERGSEYAMKINF